MRRTFAAIVIGVVVLASALLVGRLKLLTPLPFLVLLPGVLVGALAPDSGFNPEADTHSWGLVSTAIVWLVNIALYSGIAYVALSLFRYLRTPGPK